jgi:membrane protease YdiL (CAAX protease family)
MERGKFLKLTGLLSAPLSFVVMTVVGFILGIFLAMTSASGTSNLDSAMSSSIFIIITLYATIASYPVLLAFPFIRRAMRELDFFGLTRLKERMRTRTTGGAVAKAMGVGTLTTVLFIGFEVLASYVISLIPSLSWMSGTSKDTSTTSGEISSALTSSHLVGALLTVVATAILIPLCEEIVFRGLTAMSLRESSLFSKLRQGPRTFLICIISGLYFGAVHFQSSAPLAVSIYTMILMTIFGTVLTYIAAFKYKSLAPTLWAHMLNNAIAMF